MDPREKLEQPRYRDDPVFYFVEQLVIDTIERLPLEQGRWLAETLRTDLDAWRLKVKELSSLSDTFEVAVLDLWYRNSQIASDRGDHLSAQEFAMLFVDNYYADDSQVDVRGPGALEAAFERIELAQAQRGQRRQ